MSTIDNNQLSIIRQLDVGDYFSQLPAQQKLYAHHLCRAAWHGARIVMRQTSPESISIFELIKSLYKECGGQWKTLVKRCGVSAIELDGFMQYAAMFLCNLGNFYGEGNQKIVPSISRDSLWKLACISAEATEILEKVIDSIYSLPPHSLGFPNTDSMSNYYPGSGRMTKEEIAKVSSVLDSNDIGPENTRIRKITDGDTVIYHVLQASTDYGSTTELSVGNELHGHVRLVGGDHGQELAIICSELAKAAEYATSEIQTQMLSKLIDSFRSGSMEEFREFQKLWVTDKSPEVENMIGFAEPYRDPFGVRAEWGAVICLTDPQETLRMRRIVDRAKDFIHLLPWSMEDVNGGNGPFEKPEFEAPEYTSVHVRTWYQPGQTWGGLFEDLAMSVEESRATLISQYLVDNQEILSIFGYDDSTEPSAKDIIYSTYMQIGVDGLQALTHFDAQEQTWGEPHMRGHFGILKYLLTEGDGVLSVDADLDAQNITIRVDEGKILSHGKPALGQLLCRYHIWRCTADVKSCREFYEPLTSVTGQYEDWRRIVCQKPETRWKYVQPNTIRKDDDVELKIYETSDDGIIRSWMERNI
ncbi:Peptidase M49, dipeptidyl-peptidase III [Akanthomyces lecanii RCEF 1005]|uniref:Peptidase M49, dipeptidyl-peptidase III n=1 Tax=Akanthomyces lecanii RCEF 1005 TaxID=1081108 RepID=A0A168D1D8_CORDF|nr:Peptidase M49, dipeptidyl-peptidase III [Akanthomyces lecanii RCEF 1005]